LLRLFQRDIIAEDFFFVAFPTGKVLPFFNHLGDLFLRQAIAFNQGGVMRRIKPGGLA
jgi:hypothetical protein